MDDTKIGLKLEIRLCCNECYYSSQSLLNVVNTLVVLVIIHSNLRSVGVIHPQLYVCQYCELSVLLL